MNNRLPKTKAGTGLLLSLAAISIWLLAVGSATGCKVYSFRDISIPDSIQVIKVNFIENRATYINPNLSPRLTDRLRQKIVSQTRLKQTNGSNADWEVDAVITGYSFSTSGISNQQVATNRLTVAIKITLNKLREGTVKEFDVSRSFDFSASQSIQQAESALFDEMIRGLSDDMFNRIFSNW
jgi:hypothetical protein